MQPFPLYFSIRIITAIVVGHVLPDYQFFAAAVAEGDIFFVIRYFQIRDIIEIKHHFIDYPFPTRAKTACKGKSGEP